MIEYKLAPALLTIWNLTVYSENPEPPDLLDLTVVAVCLNSSFDSLGVLAPGLSQNEMSGSVPSQHMVMPQSEVFGSQNMILPQNDVFSTVLLQNEAFEIAIFYVHNPPYTQKW